MIFSKKGFGILLLLMFTACGETSSNSFEIIETGVIEPGDLTDGNHSNLAYDLFEFHVDPLDIVTVSVTTEDFDPMLKLVEVSTGAVLAEWDSQYSEDSVLTYRIAGGGICQARVYALDHSSGSYSLTISVD